MRKYYTLDGKDIVEIDDVIEWAKAFGEIDRVIATSTVKEKVSISTVFLGLDYQWNDGPPLLFETMVFGGSYDGDQWRYSTWEEAEKGHQKVVSMIKGES